MPGLKAHKASVMLSSLSSIRDTGHRPGRIQNFRKSATTAENAGLVTEDGRIGRVVRDQPDVAIASGRLGDAEVRTVQRFWYGGCG